MELQPGVRIAGKYELERVLGTGGMGTVWLARHVELGERRVAVKFLLNAVSPEMLERFRREALLASRIRTRHAVEVLDFGDHEGAPYLVMEYLEGQDLRGLLDQQQRIEPALALAIVGQAARGLQKAHDAGLIHRDIKPENLFLTRDEDGEMLVKILDFGIAKSQAVDSGTATGMMIGTAYYMSPEQFQGLKTLDHRTDLWSLACVVYEMLVGARTFVADSVLMIGMKILGQDRPVPSSVVSGLPPGFDAWFAKALHPDISQRFASATELCAALARALEASGASFQLPAPARASSGVASRGPEFSTTAIAASAADSDRQPRPSRGPWRWVAGVAGAMVVATVGGAAFLALRSAEPASAEQASGLAQSVAPPPSVAASDTPGGPVASIAEAEAPVLSLALAMAHAGDVEGAHRLLADLASDSPSRADDRFAEVENTWADHQLTEAQRTRDVEAKAQMLTEVTKSGADAARRSRARSLLDAMARPRSDGKTAGKSTPKDTGKPPPPPPATTQPASPSTGSLPPRF